MPKNRPMFHGAIKTIKVAHFYGPWCINVQSTVKTQELLHFETEKLKPSIDSLKPRLQHSSILLKKL